MTAFASPAWQASGVRFTSSQKPESPLLITNAQPDLHFQWSPSPPWQAEEWREALPLARDVDDIEGSWVEVRRWNNELWYATQWNGDLRIGSAHVIGHPRFADNGLPLEMEFLELGLAFYLNLKGVPVFHGAAVAVDDYAIGLFAASGSGKSSLALALVQHGCGLLSDDIVAVHSTEYLVWPGHFHMRVHADTAASLLNPGQCSALFPRYMRTKYVTNVQRWGMIQTKPVPLRAIYMVDARPDASEIALTHVQGYHAVHALVGSEIGGRSGDAHSTRLGQLTMLLRSVPVRRLVYPRRFDILERVVNAVIADSQRCQPTSGPLSESTQRYAP